MLSIRGLTKVYPGPVAALQGVDLDMPIRDVRPARTQRRRQDDAHADRRRAARADLRARSRWTARTSSPSRSGSGRSLGYLPQEFGFYPHLTGEAMLLHLLQLKGVEAPGPEEARAPSCSSG